MPEKVVSRLRTFIQKLNQSRFPVIHGYTKTKPRSVPGFARLHKNVTKVGSRLRSVTQKRNKGRFPVTHGYVNSQKRCLTERLHGYARNRVTSYADP